MRAGWKDFDYEGQQFEDFFTNIMIKGNSNFSPVKSYGNIGDRQKDGFDKYKGISTPIHQKILELRKQFSNVEFAIFPSNKLEDKFLILIRKLNSVL
ncbi:hypothetical protein ISU02_08435 [Fusibacter sp. Q10-2]|uniref:Uncharacterized protein n=1 Tax=Fusibacter ferrireducens TaxID=2785058 RepID=A0ABR9ZRR2_9FIRM|nr:hypothetical protein [Fusibacter ferrireducens]